MTITCTDIRFAVLFKTLFERQIYYIPRRTVGARKRGAKRALDFSPEIF